MTKKVCEWCGKNFEDNSKSRYCSIQCRTKGRTRTAFDIASMPMLTPHEISILKSNKDAHVCRKCRLVFHVKSPDDIFCSEKCKEGFTEEDEEKLLKRREQHNERCARWREKNREGGPIYPPRKCHDCGRPTRDYRCASCQAKWKKRNGVISTATEDF